MKTPIEFIDDEVKGYQGAMSPLAHALSRCTNRALDMLADDLDRMLERAGYEPHRAMLFLNGQADASTVMRIEELVRQCPEKAVRRVWESVIGQITSGSLTNRKAIRHIVKLSAYSVLDDMLKSSARILSGVAEDGYLHGVFALQKETGIGWNTDKLLGGRTQIIVSHVFDMAEAMDFINPIIDMSNDKIIYSLLKGSDRKEVVNSTKPVKEAQVYRSKRQARTAITETAGQAHMEAYEKHGVKKYEYVATYDERTCPVCGGLDGKTFPLNEAKAGKNYPPMHPNCRCTTVAALSKEIKAEMAPRTYVDKSTGVVHDLPTDFTYSDWLKTFGPDRKDGVEYVPKKKR